MASPGWGQLAPLLRAGLGPVFLSVPVSPSRPSASASFWASPCWLCSPALTPADLRAQERTLESQREPRGGRGPLPSVRGNGGCLCHRAWSGEAWGSGQDTCSHWFMSP